MTLATLIDVIPFKFHDKMIIYRIKPADVYDTTNRIVYVRKRYVAVREDSYSFCICMQGVHQGIPCQHIFAVLRRYLQHGFKIDSVHSH